MFFKEYYKKVLMLESAEADETNKHLTHLDEYILVHGKDGGIKTIKYIEQLLGILHSHTDKPINTTVKWDGAPAVVVGNFNGQFFVSSKSAFNTVPVLNYSIQDIRKNHKAAPGLVDKLIKVFKVLAPYANEFDGAYQGDLLFTKDSVKSYIIDGEKYIGFKPNTILYSVKEDSVAAQKIINSDIGVVFHTKYAVQRDHGTNPGNDVSGKPSTALGEFAPEAKIVFTNKQFGIRVDHLKKIPGVYITDALFEDKAGTISLTNNETVVVKRALALLKYFVSSINYRSLQRPVYKDWSLVNTINTFLNAQIRKGQFLDNIDSSLEEYKNWVLDKIEADLSKLKKEETKAKKRSRKRKIEKVINFTHGSLTNLFKFIKSVKFIKDIFIQKYNDIVRHQSIKSYLIQPNGDIVATNPEGYVAFDSDQNGIKFVDRLEFSRANFTLPKDWGTSGTPTEEEANQTAVKESLSNQNKAVVFAYGRYNPPTIGHQKLIDTVVNAANNHQADYLIIPSHSTKPPEKNPLSISQKIEILKHMVPDASKVSEAGATYINALQKIQEMGYENVIQVAGSDREPEFMNLVKAYNGKPDKTGNIPFNFKSFNFVSAGERDPDSEGVEGMSASKIRKLAADGRINEFKSGMADSVPDNIKQKTYDEIRKIILK